MTEIRTYSPGYGAPSVTVGSSGVNARFDGGSAFGLDITNNDSTNACYVLPNARITGAASVMTGAGFKELAGLGQGIIGAITFSGGEQLFTASSGSVNNYNVIRGDTLQFSDGTEYPIKEVRSEVVLVLENQDSGSYTKGTTATRIMRSVNPQMLDKHFKWFAADISSNGIIIPAGVTKSIYGASDPFFGLALYAATNVDVSIAKTVY